MSATALFPRRTTKQTAFRQVEKNLTMNSSTALLGAVLCLFLLPVVVISEAKAQQDGDGRQYKGKRVLEDTRRCGPRKHGDQHDHPRGDQ